MQHTRRTLALSSDWDIYLSDTGQFKEYVGAWSTAQAVANECRRFLNDTYFDYDIGIPHFDIELGHPLPEAPFRNALRNAALRVDDVAEVIDVEIESFDKDTRVLTGNITFRTIESNEEINLVL